MNITDFLAHGAALVTIGSGTIHIKSATMDSHLPIPVDQTPDLVFPRKNSKTTIPLIGSSFPSQLDNPDTYRVTDTCLIVANVTSAGLRWVDENNLVHTVTTRPPETSSPSVARKEEPARQRPVPAAEPGNPTSTPPVSDTQTSYPGSGVTLDDDPFTK